MIASANLIRRALFALAFAVFALPSFAAELSGVHASAPQGPKKRVAVAKVETPGKFAQEMGSTDVGMLMADQLASILAETGDFDVMDRGDVAMLLKEQALAPGSAKPGEASDLPADLLGAQVVVRASVTSYGQQSGGGVSFGVGGEALSGLLGRKTDSSTIGIDIRLVDVTTSRVVATVHAQGKASNSSMVIGLRKGAANLTKENYNSTVLGDATRQAFLQAEPAIAAKLNGLSWVGRVAEVADGQTFLNIGAAQGAKVGDAFQISRPGRRIIDPASGEVLGVTEAPVGRVTIVEVNDRFSRVAAELPLVIQRGDFARFIRN
jgi:curli biogenesis system outer membrane secretion channel CsgG